MNTIVVPTKIKIGHYSIKIIEQGDELLGVCGQCSVELKIRNFEFFCCESEWVFCSENCMDGWVKDNKPEDGY